MMLEFVIQLFKDTLKLSFTICNYLLNSFVKVDHEIKCPPDIDLDDIK